MIVVGVALPFNHSVYRPAQEWPKLHEWVMGPSYPPRSEETPEELQQQVARIGTAAAIIRHQLDEARPDVMVVLATDHGRLFSNVQVPQLCTFTGDELWGSTRIAELNEPADGEILKLNGAPDLAAFIQEELVYHKFDMSYSRVMRPLGQPEYGADASLVEAVRLLTPALNIPVVAIFMNTQLDPAPSGQRCYALGKALGSILGERHERIALVASGGMSHDHHGLRAGFVDDMMDQWVLKTLGRGLSERMAPMFSMDSDSHHGGTAELRLWMAAGAACENFGSKAITVDYFPSPTAGAGIGFAYWPLSPAQH